MNASSQSKLKGKKKRSADDEDYLEAGPSQASFQPLLGQNSQPIRERRAKRSRKSSVNDTLDHQGVSDTQSREDSIPRSTISGAAVHIMQGEEEVELQADFEVDPSQLPMIPKRGEPMKKRPFKHGDLCSLCASWSNILLTCDGCPMVYCVVQSRRNQFGDTIDHGCFSMEDYIKVKDKDFYCHRCHLLVREPRPYKLLTGSEDRKGYNLQLRPLIVVALLGGREHCATDSMVFPLQESMNPWGTYYQYIAIDTYTTEPAEARLMIRQFISRVDRIFEVDDPESKWKNVEAATRVLIIVEQHASSTSGQITYKPEDPKDKNNHNYVETSSVQELFQMFLGEEFINRYLKRDTTRPHSMRGLVMLTCYQALKYNGSDYKELVRADGQGLFNWVLGFSTPLFSWSVMAPTSSFLVEVFQYGKTASRAVTDNYLGNSLANRQSPPVLVHVDNNEAISIRFIRANYYEKPWGLDRPECPVCQQTLRPIEEPKNSARHTFWDCDVCTSNEPGPQVRNIKRYESYRPSFVCDLQPLLKIGHTYSIPWPTPDVPEGWVQTHVFNQRSRPVKGTVGFVEEQGGSSVVEVQGEPLLDEVQGEKVKKTKMTATERWKKGGKKRSNVVPDTPDPLPASSFTS